MMRVVGGEMGSAASLAPKVGPLGLSPKVIGEDIQKNTMDWKGLRVTVRLRILNRKATVEVVPSASSLIIKELNEPYCARKDRDGPAEHDGNISFEQERVITNILNLEHLRARDLMTPKTVVFTLDRSLTLEQGRKQAGRWSHTRVPLYDGSPEKIVSMVLRHDVFDGLADGKEDHQLSKFERPVHVVPESARASELLKQYLSILNFACKTRDPHKTA